MNLRSVSLPLIVISYITIIACGSTQTTQNLDVSAKSKDHTIADTTPTLRKVGGEIGDVAPDFQILLTTGETVSYSDFRRTETPIFLFFFNTI